MYLAAPKFNATESVWRRLNYIDRGLREMRHFWILFGLAGALVVSHAAENPPLLKPIITAGAGEAVDGLRASVNLVKPDFGPGESLMVNFKLINESNQPKKVKLGKNHVFDFAFEAKRDARELNTARVEFNDFHSPERTLQPGESLTRTFDLRAVQTVDAKWADDTGRYEVRVSYIHKNIKSGWVRFSIGDAGERLPEPDEATAEKIRTLIAQLGDDDFAGREKASAGLLALGMVALRQLQDATEAGLDAEITARCRKLIEDIRRQHAIPPKPKPVPPPQPAPPPPPVPPGPPEPPPDEF